MQKVLGRSMAIATLLLSSAGAAQARPIQGPACRVTIPTGSDGVYGTALLSVGGLRRDGTVVFKPGGPGFLTSDGGLGMKFGWTRGIAGQLKVTGRRLDGVAAPLRLDAPRGYGDIGFQASHVIFSTPGCWEVVAQVGEHEDSRITFVTNVVKIGEGPAWRREPSGL
jgi:hypothetical protein